MTETDKDLSTVTPQIGGVTIYVTCPCGCLTYHEIDCEEGDDGVWAAAMEDRFILCETCNQLMDVGQRLSVSDPE